ncbi:unnamed protein product, partial [Heterotrigona itama]
IMKGKRINLETAEKKEKDKRKGRRKAKERTIGVNLTPKGNIPADGVLLSRIPAGKKSKVVTIDLGNSLFTELAEGRNQEEKKKEKTRQKKVDERGKKCMTKGLEILPTILLINNYRRISGQ